MTENFFAVQSILVGDEIVEKFSDVSQAAERHVIVDAGLMLDKNQKLVANLTGNVVLESAEKISLQRLAAS